MSSPAATYPRRAARLPRSRRPTIADGAHGHEFGPIKATEPHHPGDLALSSAIAAGRILGGYENEESGERREIIGVPVSGGGVLVIDCGASDRSDPRLLADIAADEPAGNARLVCQLYLADADRGVCRRVTLEDIAGPPARRSASDAPPPPECHAAFTELPGFRIHVPAGRTGTPQVRWVHAGAGECSSSPVTLRDVVASVEAYEPATQMTVAAIRAHPIGCGVSTSTLRMELQRLQASRVVLNRGLREAVERALASGISMSEIARRCGRTKRDERGNVSGETSWLARRVGRMPEAGQSRPTPWVHSDTLALIARQGLRLSPLEVEL